MQAPGVQVDAELERDGLIEPAAEKRRRARAQPVTAELDQMARWSGVPVPDLSRGSCVGHEHSDWWVSDDRRQRSKAAEICRQECPVLQACLAWALQLPHSGNVPVVLGGLGTEARRRQREPRQERGGDHCAQCGADLTVAGNTRGRKRPRCRACMRRYEREYRRRRARRAA